MIEGRTGKSLTGASIKIYRVADTAKVLDAALTDQHSQAIFSRKKLSGISTDVICKPTEKYG